MVGGLLLRGMLVGIVAAVIAFGFAKTFGEPQVDRAIAFEKQVDQAKGEPPAHEIVSRQTQAGLGLFTGVVVYGAALGGLFSLVFSFVYGRVGGLDPRSTAALLALAGFISIVLIPGIKYPANPPSVGNPDTIGSRTALFFTMIIISVATLVLAISLARGLVIRLGGWNAVLLGAATYLVIVAIVQYALPEINEVPDDFSAVVLWRFRVASLGIHIVLWTTIGLLFGALTQRVLAQTASGHFAAISR
jgi:predicted cobalt transporter CbtA